MSVATKLLTLLGLCYYMAMPSLLVLISKYILYKKILVFLNFILYRLIVEGGILVPLIFLLETSRSISWTTRFLVICWVITFGSSPICPN